MSRPAAVITGSNGFVGSHLAEHLLSRGVDVTCLVRRTSDIRWLRPLQVQYLYADLQEADRLKSIMPDVDYVFHCGGVTKALRRDKFFSANALGTRHLLEAVRRNCRHLKRFVYVSSLAAAGPCSGPEPIDEGERAHPVTWYGESKLAGERVARQFADDLPVTLIRPPAVYGPRDTDMYEAFRSVKFRVMPTVGFRKRLVSVIYVTDLVRGMAEAALSAKTVGNTYYLSSDTRIDWMSFNREIADSMHVQALPVYVPVPVFATIAAMQGVLSRISGKPHIINLQKLNEYKALYWMCDRSAAERDFGYKPEYCVTRGVRLTLEWYQANGWL